MTCMTHQHGHDAALEFERGLVGLVVLLSEQLQLAEQSVDLLVHFPTLLVVVRQQLLQLDQLHPVSVVQLDQSLCVRYGLPIAALSC